MKLRGMNLGATAIALGVALALSGCPEEPTFEVWLINDSEDFLASSVKVNGDESTRELVRDQGVAPESVRTFAPVSASPFLEQNLTIVVTGIEANGKGSSVDAMVTISEPLQAGTTLPILVTGNGALSYSAQYLPLDPASKFRQRLENAAP